MAIRFLRTGIGPLVLPLILVATAPALALLAHLALAARAEHARAVGFGQQQAAMAAAQLALALAGAAADAGAPGLDRLAPRLAGSAGPAGGVLLLVSADGTPRMPAPPAFDGDAASALAAAIGAAPAGWIRLATPGGERLVGFARAEPLGLTVAVATEAAAHAAFDRRLAAGLALAALAVLAGGAAALLLARALLGRPLQALAAAAAAAAAGGPSPTLPARPWLGALEPLRRSVAALIADLARRGAALEAAHAELAAATDLLHEAAHRDPLTGLADRRAFEAALAAAWTRSQREATPVGLLVLDLDHFRAFNDRYGRVAGDGCLMRVAHLLTELELRPFDLIARLGGEEFALLLPDTDLPGTVAVGERIRAALHAMLLLHEGSPFGFVTASVGAASLVPVAAIEPQVLLAAADRALAAAKAGGRDRVAAAGLAAAA